MTKREIFNLMKGLDPYGALHIIIDDGNCEDDHLEFCRKQPDLLVLERVLLDELAKLTVEEREEIWSWL